MGRLLTLSVFALIGCVVWLLMPDSEPALQSKSKRAAKTDRVTGSEMGKVVKAGRTSDVSKAPGALTKPTSSGLGVAPTEASEMNPVDLTPELFEKSRQGRAEAKRLRAQAQENEEEGAPNPGEDNPYFNVHWDGEIQYNDLEDKLLKLYSQRTPDGRLPPGITAEDVLSAEVLKILKVSPATPVLLIGDHHATHQVAITDTLKVARAGEYETGFTFDDGSEGGRRVYIKVRRE